jgi:GTP-binding protein EngB required for normal cell division
MKMLTNNALAPRALKDALDRASRTVDAASGEQSPIAVQLNALRERLAQNRLHIAILGQFKRGKSSFVNALLGATLLPTAVVPLTAIPTFIAWAEKPSLRVSFADGRAPEGNVGADPLSLRRMLAGFVTEESNPKNILNVARVELFYPAATLRDGTVLIDTPGIGSTLAHNTETALRVVPECDASLFILSVDPPITEAEIDYLHRLKQKISPIFFVLNKIDYLSDSELVEASRFLRSVLQRASLIDDGASVFAVSARRGLAAQENGDQDGFVKSGMAAIQDHLTRYLAKAKIATLHNAVRGKAIDLVTQAEADLDLRIQTLTMPLDQLAQKADAFGKVLSAVEAQHATLGDLLSGDRRRLVQDLESKIERLRDQTLTNLTPTIDDLVFGAPETPDEGLKSDVPAALEMLFTDAGAAFAAEFARQTNDLLARYRRTIETAVDEIRRTAAELFDVPWKLGDTTISFALRQEPYWSTERLNIRLIPDLAPFVDSLLPRALARQRRRARLMAQTGDLILRNAENLRWAILRGIEETFRNAGVELDQRLSEVVAATKGVIEDALRQRQNRSFASEDVLARVNRAKDDLGAAAQALRNAAFPGNVGCA